MKKAIWWIVGIIVVVVIVLLSTKNNQLDAGPIKIGFMGPLSGEVSNYGENAKAAVEIAVDEINTSGGINGRPIEVIYEDDQCSGPKAASAANKLIDINKVPVILGGLCSSATLSFAPIAEKAKTVVLSYCATNPTLSAAGDYIFRDVPPDIFQGRYAADYVFNKLGLKKVAILYQNDEWGSGVQKEFTTAFIKLGGEVIETESYSPKTTDLRAQLTKISLSKPDGLYFLGFPDATISGIKQAKVMGMNVPMIGADAWDSPATWEKLGKLADGIMYTVMGTKSSPDFKNKMKTKTGSDDIVYCSNYAYDGLKIIAQAMKNTGTDSESIKNGLYKVVYTGGVSSDEIRFNSDGDPVNANYVVKVIKDGKAEVVTQ